MTVVISAHIPLASVADRDKCMQYLSLVRDVASETQENEPECLAYCWARPADGHTDVPAVVQGLEVYNTPEALSVTHRSSAPYKNMRQVVANTGLLSRPKGGVPTYVPAGTGFLSKEGTPETVSSENWFIVVEYTARGQENLNRLLEKEGFLSRDIESVGGVLTLVCFVPDSHEEEIPVTIFLRVSSKGDDLDAVKERLQRFEDEAASDGEVTQKRFWEGQGFGFFRKRSYID
ncbi:uncharacterized protein TRUGW13939_02820 [Talaromyces rugulosus]|uniref:ABM domain-containing protein n=1 Tax=Talaromyces rugulosus TaxID=121627 RepID=A0A7H8QRG6_TALRU|nr:uncharacterized protein TRUGW13939_02820 [Talaromyces rugulosus]QKX55723.1 hypothetical protein TRUGW13939_02820 [Talaromyces rugulosus]